MYLSLCLLRPIPDDTRSVAEQIYPPNHLPRRLGEDHVDVHSEQFSDPDALLSRYTLKRTTLGSKPLLLNRMPYCHQKQVQAFRPHSK